MRKIFYLILVVLFFSCTKKNVDDVEVFDFGVIEFEEPFRGLLDSKPSILKKSLEYPPYKWLAPDTMILQKTFVVNFNEDAIRSNSTATLFFVDTSCKPIDGIIFHIKDDASTHNIVKIVADSLSKEITVVCKISPTIGEQIKTGKILVVGNELDEINARNIQQDSMTLAEWQVEQRLNFPWLLWLLWLLTIIIIIAIIYFIINLIIHSQGYFVIMKLFASPFKSKSIKPNLFSFSKINEDYSLGMPKSIEDGGKGRWTGRRGDSIYIFDKDQRPKTANYGNMKNQTFGELGRDLGDPSPQVRFRKGYPVFDRDPATTSQQPLEVSFPQGIGQYLKKKSNGTIDRQYLHDAAFEKIANKYGMSIDELKVFKGDSSPVSDLVKRWNCSEEEVWRRCNNPHKIQRVLHEVEDAKRVQLVPRIYHDNVTHSGGVEKVAKHIF